MIFRVFDPPPPNNKKTNKLGGGGAHIIIYKKNKTNGYEICDIQNGLFPSQLDTL